MIGKIKYELYKVKLNAQNVILSHIDDTLLKNHARHQSSAASVHRHHELSRPAAAFIPICIINDAGVSGANVSGYSCESMKFWAFNLTLYNAYSILPIICITCVNIKLFCCTQCNNSCLMFTKLTLSKSYCSRISPVSVFRVLQSSGVTPLKCGEIHNMDFVANFTENTTVKKCWKTVNICQTYERMYSGTVFIETQCNCDESTSVTPS